jgi:hypothetical protein
MSPAIGLDDDTLGLHTLFDQLVLVDDARGKDHKGGCKQGAAEVEKQCMPEQKLDQGHLQSGKERPAQITYYAGQSPKELHGDGSEICRPAETNFPQPIQPALRRKAR